MKAQRRRNFCDYYTLFYLYSVAVTRKEDITKLEEEKREAEDFISYITPV
jgi:hypothetical protein